MVLLYVGFITFVQQKSSQQIIVPENTEDGGGYGGLTVELAEQLATNRGVSFRVVMRDGVPLPATADYRPGRVNAEVTQGKISGYTIE